MRSPEGRHAFFFPCSWFLRQLYSRSSPDTAEKVSKFLKSIFGNNEKKAADEAVRVKAAEKLEAKRLLCDGLDRHTAIS